MSLAEPRPLAFVVGSMSRSPMVSGSGGILVTDCFQHDDDELSLIFVHFLLIRIHLSLHKCYTVIEVFLATISARAVYGLVFRPMPGPAHGPWAGRVIRNGLAMGRVGRGLF